MKSNVLLWFAQGLLALVFLFAGGMKLALPLDALKGPIPLPGLFLRFIGVAEVAGAAGLILPWLLGIRPALTPLAAAGLVVIMTGATALTVAGGPAALALIPLTVGALSACGPLSRSDANAIRVPSGDQTTIAILSRVRPG
ncbi:MAG: DoxX family protein [Betaproteobacteria bacterium]